MMVIWITATIGEANAQDSKLQAGFRFGNTTGFTGKIIKNDYHAFEGILGFRSGGMQLYGLLEARRPVFHNRLENMYFYFGGGAHAGFVRWSTDNKDAPYYYPYYQGEYYNQTGPAFGLDGVIGMEYAFTTVPVSIAADFKPFVEVFGPFFVRVNFWDFGFHVRYNF